MIARGKGKGKGKGGSEGEATISIIGPGTRVHGDLETEGTVRIEGEVRGDVTADKAVVLGAEGVVEGDIRTHDAVLSGIVRGTVVAVSRLEVHASCRIDGEVRARRMQLEEGAVLNGSVAMGDEVSFDAHPAEEKDGHPRGAEVDEGAELSM